MNARRDFNIAGRSGGVNGGGGGGGGMLGNEGKAKRGSIRIAEIQSLYPNPSRESEQNYHCLCTDLPTY